MSDNAPPDPVLAGFRKSIDNIDAALVHLLAERFKCTQAVGRLKATVGLPPSDPERERVQVARLRDLAAETHSRALAQLATRMQSASHANSADPFGKVKGLLHAAS